MEKDISQKAISYVFDGQRVKSKSIATREPSPCLSILLKQTHNRTRFLSGRLQQTSVSLKDRCAHCRWAGNFAATAIYQSYWSSSSQRVATESCAGAGISLRSSNQCLFSVSSALWLRIPINRRKLRRRIRAKLLAKLLRAWKPKVSVEGLFPLLTKLH